MLIRFFHYKPSILGTPIYGNPYLVKSLGTMWVSSAKPQPEHPQEFVFVDVEGL